MNRTHAWYFLRKARRPSSIVGVGRVPTLHRHHRPFMGRARRPSSIVGVGLVPTLHRHHRPFMRKARRPSSIVGVGLVPNTSHLSQKEEKQDKKAPNLAYCQKAKRKKPGAFDVQITRNESR